MEGRQGDGLGDLRVELDVAQRRERTADLGPQPLYLGRSVVHLLDEPGDLLGTDALEVVPHRHVEHVRAGIAADELGDRFPVPQDLDDHPRLDVLLDALRDEEFLAPLDVVPDRLHVDAGALDVEIIENLHGLQLEQPRPAEPRQHDVLRHLAVRPGGRTDRCRGATAEELERQVDVVVRLPEASGRQVEDPLARRPLVCDPAEQVAERHRRERWRSGRLG